MKELLICIFAALVGVLGFAALIFWLAYLGMSWSCDGYERATGKPTKVVTVDCYIKDGDQWYSWEEYKYRLVTKGEMEP